jgi:hypothetical protein
MQLLILLIIFIWLGYVLARSQTGKKIDQAVEDSIAWTENSFQRLMHRFKRDTTKQNQPVTFSEWVSASGKLFLPIDVYEWINSLSNTNARRFEASLSEYLASKGIDLNWVIQSPNQNSGRMQIFVEAVVVYSRDYQNAVRTKPKKKSTRQEQPSNDLPQIEEKAAAQKQPSRRKSAPTSSAAAPTSGGD